MHDVIRVVLADDHPIVRDALRRLVNAQADMRVVGEAEDGEAACQTARHLLPDVMVMDLSMPKLNGVQATEWLRKECPDVRVLVLTVHEERHYLTQLLRAGAAGYVLKRAAPSELVLAVRTVAGGGTYIDPGIAGTMVQVYLGAQQEDDQRADDVLSDREREVLMKIARGLSNKEIAGQLGLSVKTVETYKGRVAEKLGLRTRVDIVRYAARRGWLESEDDPKNTNSLR